MIPEEVAVPEGHDPAEARQECTERPGQAGVVSPKVRDRTVSFLLLEALQV